MNKYIYSICEPDDFPYIDTIVAKSYAHAVDKLIKKFVDEYEDDNDIVDIGTLEDLQVYLNEHYTVVISDLYDTDDFS